MRLASVFLILGFAVLGAHLWGMAAPDPANWGVHQYGFLPGSWLAAGFALGLVVFLAVQGTFRSLTGFGSRAAIWMPLTAAAAGGLFWLGRERSFFLGDGLVWARAVGEGRLLGHNEPALAWGFFGLYRALGHPDPQALLGVISVICGALFVLLALLFARTAARDAGGAALVFGFAVLAGFTRLFYGHIEIYAMAAVVLLAYLLLAARHLQGRVGLWAPALLFAVCVPSHVLAVMLLPSLLYLVLRSPAPAWQRVVWMVVPVALAAVALQLGWRDPRAAGVVLSGHLKELLPLTGDLTNRTAGHLFSPAHLRDFVQEQLFLGPFVAVMALVLWVARRPGGRERDETFLLWAGIPWWLLSFAYNREIGAARDWGAFALASVPLALFAGTALARHPWRREGGGLAAATIGLLLGVSAVHTVGVVGVDHDPDRGLRHFAGLFAPKAPVSGFARAYAFEELGNTYLAQEEFGNAEVAYATAVEADSSNVRLAGNLGSVRLLTGNVEGAIQVLESATRREPGNAVLLYQLADAYRGAGRLDDAAAAYRAAITANPTLLDAYLVLAALQRDRGEMGAAVGVLSDAQKRFPNSGLVKLNLGRVYEQSGMPEEAMAAYRDGLELLPGDNGAAFNLARLYMNSDHPTEAVAVLEALVRRDPGDVEAWINLGGALDRLGRKEPSVEAFRQANRLDPGRPEPYFNLARSYMIDSRPDLAMQVLQRYAAFDSTSDAGMRAKALLRRLRAEAVADTMP